MGDTDAAKFLAGCCLRGVGGKADPTGGRWYKVAYEAGFRAQGALADIDTGMGGKRRSAARRGRSGGAGPGPATARLDSSRGGMTAKERRLARYDGNYIG